MDENITEPQTNIIMFIKAKSPNIAVKTNIFIIDEREIQTKNKNLDQ